ncbi:MAG: hypothetical protein US83_C0013G0011 [Candidatus Falkowbacteria bacterium GW2011_GWC2_38_22]|uniref:histidine kinase n=1 Tax=Candidatus Falkowbacteria bacterium GW2011_GWE1_38_31 TaxID=1618638 RepID=A0A0G0JTI6_9BACT|nr:MAG: hypothetical protein US73_C0006G0072 [Candidatus Falkowbacteria bacterium GW2011_GWF2_38_1205]KKQ60721.1 MAG: hypothetical protein US83_C0013G0011 [Candidatus Falkowbacteria bacterium GW2011_GWC2_38_22]KKQ63260.1 MAG: hypothetical protein US84_C0007G0002 [Candidatus Falkowbacteria bacterium GW2011_GWF1_38_22]KKQ65622.1 MAG: hypothetical protein US87_C0006G0072 [Candidatus Falkowbacteria bacterium GW2011_GWE2_38_254]KKQ69992.1 MAG: hypothetical protein US91_C0007G0002 [Candidatus Falkowb
MFKTKLKFAVVVFFIGIAFPLFVHAETIKSATEYDYPPFSVKTVDGKAGGFSVELLTEALAKVGKDVDFYIDSWTKIKDDLINGKIQVLPLVGRTPEREPFYDFTVPYISLYGAIFTRTEDKSIKTFDDLREKEIAVMKGDSAEEFILRKNISGKVISTVSYEEAFKALSSGKYDAVITQQLVGEQTIVAEKISNLKIAARIDEFKQDFTFAVKKGDSEMLALLNEGLSKLITDGTYDGLYKKWLISESDTKDDLENIEEAIIRNKAQETAKRADEYIKNNPKFTIADLQKDAVFQDIAVQIIGDGGYTGIMDLDSGYFYFHPQKNLVNTDSHVFLEKLPDFWKIFSNTMGDDCRESFGRYDWKEADNTITKKYMHTACLNNPTADGKRLFVGATAYINRQDAEKYLEKYEIEKSFLYAKSAIKQKAEDVARQVEIYLKAHPEKTVSDLQADEYFQNIAVQTVGKTGYTAVTDSNTLVNYFHKNKKLINTDFSLLAEKFPEFYAITVRAKEGKKYDGVYNWLEEDGSVKKKYMYIVNVNSLTADNVSLNVAATTYLDEYAADDVLSGEITGDKNENLDSNSVFINVAYWLMGIIISALFILLLLNGFGFVSIGRNMVFSFFGVITLIIITLFLVNTYLVKNELSRAEEDSFYQHNENISDLYAGQIDALFKSLYDELDFLASASEDYPAESAELREILRASYARKKAYVYAAYRIDGNDLIANMFPPEETSLRQNIGEQSHIQKIKKTLAPVISNIFDAVEGFKGITIHFPVIINGEYSGTTAFLLNVDKFTDLIDIGAVIEDKQKFYLTDGSFNIIKASDTSEIGKKITEITSYGLHKKIFEEFNILGLPEQKNINVDGQNKIVSFYPIAILDNQWSIFIISDEKALNAYTEKSFSRIWMFSFALVALLVSVVIIFNILITRSLRFEINNKTIEIEKNNVLINQQLAIETEINKEKEYLLKEQKKDKARLESKNREIEKVLSDIQLDKEDLEKQRMAILNILEDVNHSGDELKKTNESLEKKKTELEALRSLGIELTSVLDLEEAVKIFCVYLSEAVEFDVATYTIVNSEEEGGLVYMAYLNKEVSEKYLNDSQNELLKYLAIQKDPGIKKSANVIKNIKPHFFGKKLDNSLDFGMKQKIVYPLTIGSNLLGAILLTSRNEADISGENKEFIEAMLSNFSLSISRLQTIVRSQNSRTGSLIESLSDGVIMFNAEKNIVLMNPRASQYTDIPIASPSINDVYSLFVEYDIAGMINRSLVNGETAHLEEIIIEKNFYELFIIPVKDVYGKIVGGAIIFHDITSLKKIDKMKTEFVSVASHQLRTPLTAIKLFTDMLIREEVGKLNPEQTEYLSNVHESTERMVRLVNDLLNVTRIESGRLRINPEQINVKVFIEGIIAEAKPLAKEKNTKIISAYDDTLPIVPLDQNLMRQVIQNLLVNAIRYAREKDGTVALDVKKNDVEFFTITVRDNGIGIPADVQDRIFEKFFRANNAIKSVTEGTGLGLYVSKMIVESSGGKIWFESIGDKGTTFFVKLPIAGMKEQKGERGLAIS